MLVVVDTSVLVDIFLKSRPRHADGKQLGRLLMDKNFTVRVPMHAMFELASAMKNEKVTSHQDSSMPYNEEYTSDNGFRVEPIAIDEPFFEKYLDVNLPYLKGGDFIFLCMAKKDNALLITEDNKLYARAKEAGVEVYRIQEFLGAFQ